MPDAFFDSLADVKNRRGTAPQAPRRVTAFVGALPANYPDRLRRIILSSADDLFRATEPR